MAKASLLMPVYNAEATLERAIHSVLCQSYKNFELICVDDGSIDRSSALLEQYARSDERVRVYRQAGNLGVGAARKRCLQEATGVYVLFVDADDYLEPHAVKTCIERASAENADMVLFRITYELGTQSYLPATTLSNRICHSLWRGSFSYQVIPQTIFQLGANLNNCFFRNDFLDTAELFLSSARYGEWIAFVNAALVHAKAISLCNEVLYHADFSRNTRLGAQKVSDAKKTYQPLIDLKNHLIQQGLFDVLKRSYVNMAAELVVQELSLSHAYNAYTTAAKFYRTYGFDALHLLGHAKEYFYDAFAYSEIRRIVLGAVCSEEEQLLLSLKLENKALQRENKKLAHKVLRWKKRYRKLKDPRAVREFLSKRLKGFLSDKKAQHYSPSTKQTYVAAMNASSGARIRFLCELMLEMDDTLLLHRRKSLAASLLQLASQVNNIVMYGRSAVSASNRVYLSFMRELITLLNSKTADPLTIKQGLRSLKARAIVRTNTKVKFVFNLEQQQVFPSFESVHAAAQKDENITADLVFAPRGSKENNWQTTSAPLFNEQGALATKQVSDYDMFKESPDILFVSRVNLTRNTKQATRDKAEHFEVVPAENSGLRVVYLPYAFFDTISETAIEFGYQAALHSESWMIVAYSEQIFSNFCKFSEPQGRNVALLGAPRFDISSGINGYRSDELTKHYARAIRERRVLLWNSHYHSFSGDGRYFMEYLQTILAFFAEHPEVVLFWRPHPKMFSELLKEDIFSQREIDTLLERVNQTENILFDQSKDYINGFALSHAMLTDGDSSLPYEYMTTGKPVIIHYVNGFTVSAWKNKYAGKMPSLYYPSFSLENLLCYLHKIKEGTCLGTAPTTDELAPFIYQHDGKAGRRVKEAVLLQLFASEKETARHTIYSDSEELLLSENLALNPDTGQEVYSNGTHLATPLFYEATTGDQLALLDSRYSCTICEYTPLTAQDLQGGSLCTLDQSFTRFSGSKTLSGSTASVTTCVHRFASHTFFRVSVQKNPPSALTWQDAVQSIIRFDALPKPARPPKQWVEQEVQNVARKLESYKSPHSVALLVLADTHSAVNGTWPDTADALRLLCEQTEIARIIHLGDLTNGNVSLGATKKYTRAMIKDMQANNVPVDLVLGCGEANFFGEGRESMTLAEQCRHYLDAGCPYYYIDLESNHLRLIYLDSYDPEQENPFGFSANTLSWLAQTLHTTPRARRVVLFSHVPPNAQFVSGIVLRGEQELLELLGRYTHQILAFVCGHTHLDLVDNSLNVPLITIACASCEQEQGAMPSGATAPSRSLDCASQECFDILVIDSVADTVQCVRFGAGEDRFLRMGSPRA